MAAVQPMAPKKGYLLSVSEYFEAKLRDAELAPSYEDEELTA